MESPFHIIHEYEILKNILSYLNYRELQVASCVCQNWRRVAHMIIEKHLEISCCFKKGNEWPSLNLKIHPKLVIYSNDSDNVSWSPLSGAQLSEVEKFIEKSYDIKDIYLIYLGNWKFINTVKDGLKLAICHSSEDECEDNNGDKFKESLLMVPEFKNLIIDTEYIGLPLSKHKMNIAAMKEKLKQAKCCLLLTSSSLKGGGMKIVEELVQDAEDNGTELVMAGGIAHFMMSNKNMIDSFEPIAATMITFSGDCLTCFSYVIPYKADLSSSFAKMSEKLGPLEAGYERLAFIFSCVDRYSIYETEEIKEFPKFFPKVQLHGFWSLGEFCMGYSDKHKKPKVSFATSKGKQFFFQQASTYLFITFKK